MSRKTTRETTFRLVYETIVTNDIKQISVDMTTNEMSIDDKEYFQKIFSHSLRKKQKSIKIKE